MLCVSILAQVGSIFIQMEVVYLHVFIQITLLEARKLCFVIIHVLKDNTNIQMDLVLHSVLIHLLSLVDSFLIVNGLVNPMNGIWQAAVLVIAVTH